MKIKDLFEEIKGWKNANRDIASARRAQDKASSEVKLVKLKKDGAESGMHDATSYFKTEEEARKKAEAIKAMNPGRDIAYNLYVNSELIGKL